MCPLLSVLGSHVVGTHAGLAHVATVSVSSSVSVILFLESLVSVLGVLHIPSGSYPSAISSSTEFPELSGEASDGDVSHTAEWSKVSHSLNVSGKSLYACIHTMYVPDDPGNQKRALDSLEMELWMVVSHPVGSKDQLSH